MIPVSFKDHDGCQNNKGQDHRCYLSQENFAPWSLIWACGESLRKYKEV